MKTLLAVAWLAIGCSVEFGECPGSVEWGTGPIEHSCDRSVISWDCQQFGGHGYDCVVETWALCSNGVERDAHFDEATSTGWVTYTERATGCESRLAIVAKE